MKMSLPSFLIALALASAPADDRPESADDTAALRAEFGAIAEQLAASENSHHGRAQVIELERALKDQKTQGDKLIGIHVQLSFEHLRLGDLGEATAHMEEAFSKVRELGGEPAPIMQKLRVIVELRRAEVSNCIQRHHRECCIFPLAGGGVHADKTAATKVREALLQILQDDPGQLEAQWLLNITSMALATYPDGVPKRFRLPPHALKSEFGIGRFVDVAPQLGLDAFNLCGGALAEDFDGDGDLDIVTTTSDPRGHAIYYHNRGDGTFEDRSKGSGLDLQFGGLNCVGADYDNDGDTDLLILRGAWMGDQGKIRNSLMRNDGGVFTDVTRAAGLAEPALPTQAAVWADFDNDGDLDLYIGNESRDSARCAANLFRNSGGGTFTDVAAAAGVTNDRLAKGVTVGDYDNDGDLDLYVSNIGKNRLFRNDSRRGEMKFVDVAVELGLQEPANRSFAPWFFDFNNDGWLDLFVTAYDATTSNLMRDYRGREHRATPPCLYLNRGGKFENVTAEAGLDHAWLPMGASFGDIDYDGFPDIYLATGDPNYETLMPNVMLRNDGGKRFQNVTTSGGFGHLQKGHGICFADLDHDGDQDMYHQLGGFFPGDKFHNALFLNPGGGGHFLVVELEGKKSNRSGIGARIAVTVEVPGGRRTVHRAVGSVSSFGGSPVRRQEIGLGDATAIVSLGITWPGEGEAEIIGSVPLDAHVRVTEGARKVERLIRREAKFPAR